MNDTLNDPPELRLWHIQVTLAGTATEPRIVAAAVERLNAVRPFLKGLEFSATQATLHYWDEAESIIDASSLALRLWNEHRTEAALPHWEVVGLEVVERGVFEARSRPAPAVLQLVPGR